MQRRIMRFGIMGGSFDPVHRGHVAVAEAALAHFGFDRFLLIPAAQAPLKPHAISASGEHRLAMLRAAFPDEKRFEISDHEIRRGGTSFTVDTLRHLTALHPGAVFHFLIGTDQLSRLPSWHRIEELARLTRFICMSRPGSSLANVPQISGLQLEMFQGPLLDISSTEVRQRLAGGADVSEFVPNKTIEYIRKNGLYC